jgi:hypothetical protein
MDWVATGISQESFGRYVDEQIYSLPGIDNHREAFSIVLTGSRATGTHGHASDLDIEVICEQPVYERVQRAAFENGIIRSADSFGMVTAPVEGWERYFGRDRGRAHYSVISLSNVKEHFRNYEDVWIWIWTNAKVVRDPGRQFERIVGEYTGYPRHVLVRKIKYHWLLAGYWSIHVSPFHSRSNRDLLAASTAILNTVNELLRVCFLVEGRPFPYAQKLMQFAACTELGKEYLTVLQRAVELVLGEAEPERDLWQRIDSAFGLLNGSDSSPDCRRLEAAFGRKMIIAGVPEQWVDADYKNIDDLLLGKLGPIPN